MKTYKRLPPEIDTDLDNYNKYFNQMNFKGILEDDNIYAIDQESFRDAKNVYVDWNDRLVSRPTLQVDKVPEYGIADAQGERYRAWSENQTLLDIKRFGSNTVYVIQWKQYGILIKVVPDNNDKITDANNASLTLILSVSANYHIASIDHYIICFNDDIGAHVFDTNQFNNMTLGQSLPGWKPIEDFVDVPVVKRVIGGQITNLPGNEFTESTKEEYIWSNESHPELPKLIPGTTTRADGNVKVTTSQETYNWGDIIATYNYPEYRILRGLSTTTKVQSDNIMTVAKGRICIATDQYFLYSFNGKTFDKVYYPSYEGTFLNIASISEDGDYFFFVASDGVYRCNLGDFTWADIIRVNGEQQIVGKGENNICCFKTGDIFSFLTIKTNESTLEPGETPIYTPILEARLYFKGPGLYSGTDKTKDKVLTYITHFFNYLDINLGRETVATYNLADYLGFGDNIIDKDLAKTALNITYSHDNDNNLIANIVLFNGGTLTTKKLILFVIGGDTTPYVGDKIQNKMLVISVPASGTPDYKVCEQLIVGYGESSINIKAGMYYATKPTQSLSDPTPWKYETVRCSLNSSATAIAGNKRILFDFPDTHDGSFSLSNGAPIPLSLNEGLVILNKTLVEKKSTVGYNLYPLLPNTLNGSAFIDTRLLTIAEEQTYYIIDANTGLIYTNSLLDSDIATITYTFKKTTTYNKVPKVSYSGTELYLGFNNLLQITANVKDGTDTYFNLPSINNQSFIDNITGMINISTTEIALFFLHKVVICSKVTDETYGYRYDYYNTKLSTGIRLGDSIINTLEGSYTVFPTRRGLAIMNYQAFMATTDQVIQYMTDNVKDMWLDFFDASEEIHIIQHRNRLIFTNNTQTILMYDLTQASWWKWEIPITALIALTDQTSLRLINEQLLIFKKSTQYFDLYESGVSKSVISWYVLSQPLHMKAPNYYKNLKQLIFQLSDSDNTKLPKSMLAQIKLYRKKITLRDPETVMFKIEELRTFVKRFNYWKINEVQWGLSNDDSTATPAPLELNGIGIKYEIGEEVR